MFATACWTFSFSTVNADPLFVFVAHYPPLSQRTRTNFLYSLCFHFHCTHLYVQTTRVRVSLCELYVCIRSLSRTFSPAEFPIRSPLLSPPPWGVADVLLLFVCRRSVNGERRSTLHEWSPNDLDTRWMSDWLTLRFSFFLFSSFWLFFLVCGFGEVFQRGFFPLPSAEKGRKLKQEGTDEETFFLFLLKSFFFVCHKVAWNGILLCGRWGSGFIQYSIPFKHVRNSSQ